MEIFKALKTFQASLFLRLISSRRQGSPQSLQSGGTLQGKKPSRQRNIWSVSTQNCSPHPALPSSSSLLHVSQSSGSLGTSLISSVSIVGREVSSSSFCSKVSIHVTPDCSKARHYWNHMRGLLRAKSDGLCPAQSGRLGSHPACRRRTRRATR